MLNWQGQKTSMTMINNLFLTKLYHVRYLSHLALQVESSNWEHLTRIHSIQSRCYFGAKTSRSTFLLEKWLHPLFYWIRYSWSRSTHILYYINLSVRWNTLLRNQISPCQLCPLLNFLQKTVYEKTIFVCQPIMTWLCKK